MPGPQPCHSRAPPVQSVGDGFIPPRRKASLVKGRWTPKAAGGILTGLALHAVTPAAGRESLRLAALGTSL